MKTQAEVSEVHGRSPEHYLRESFVHEHPLRRTYAVPLGDFESGQVYLKRLPLFSVVCEGMAVSKRLMSESFRCVSSPQSVTLVLVSANELTRRDDICYDELLKRGVAAGYELCPEEAAVAVVLAAGLPYEMSMLAAMHPFRDFQDKPRIFTVSRQPTLQQASRWRRCLGSLECAPQTMFPTWRRFLFKKRCS